MSAAMFEPGSQVDKYRIVRKLGAGGMGAVYAAEHVLLGRLVAFKVLHPEIAHHAEIVQRFMNEARAAATLKSPHVVGVHDVGQLPSGAFWIALEYLDGESLADFLARQAGPLALPLILRILAEAGAGLHVAHQHGIVHRDVKPDNLFLERVDDAAAGNLRLRLLDFGIAKLGEYAGGLKTQDRAVMGTPPYMAPEQLFDSSTVDPRSDVYALGAIAFELATGRRPWGDETRPQPIHLLQMTQPPPDPGALRAELPLPWAKVVRRALAPDVRERWPSVRDFLQALAQVTPATEWRTGRELLHQFAPELTTLADTDRTVGHKLPSGLVGAPAPGAPFFAPGPAHTPMTVSDGIPRSTDAPRPAAAPPLAGPATARLGPAAPAAVNTLDSGAGQSFAPAPARSGRPRRAWWLAAAGGAVVALVAVVVVVSGGGDGTTRADPEPRAGGAVVDGGSPATATAALAVITEPPGAVVYVGGVAKGPAPVNVMVPAGAEVVVRAELAGHVDAEQRVRVGDTPQTVRLALAAISATPDAGPPSAPVDAPPSAAVDAGSVQRVDGGARPRSRPARPRGSSTGSGSGTASGATGTGARFDPDDVGGD